MGIYILESNNSLPLSCMLSSTTIDLRRVSSYRMPPEQVRTSQLEKNEWIKVIKLAGFCFTNLPTILRDGCSRMTGSPLIPDLETIVPIKAPIHARQKLLNLLIPGRSGNSWMSIGGFLTPLPTEDIGGKKDRYIEFQHLISSPPLRGKPLPPNEKQASSAEPRVCVRRGKQQLSAK